MTFSVDQVREQLLALGVRRGGVLVVHTSFRRVRPIEDGPSGLIRALIAALGDDGTLVMPTMTNGETVFDRTKTPTHDMGITAETFWRMPGVTRSTHPGGSFAARGPKSSIICAPQPLSPPHGIESPPGRAYELDGQVLLLGVEHSENTTLHVAEFLARVPYSVSYPTVIGADDNGNPITADLAETDHCAMSFKKMDAFLNSEGLQREGPIAHAHAKLINSKDVVRIALKHLEHDPLLFLCPPTANCTDCNLAHASIKPRQLD
jgi:aminoglycoside 3-N-acetyltransferase